MIETWKESGVPLEAVCKGIDRTFEKWHAGKHKTRMVNSLAYCSQEVLSAARESNNEAPPARVATPVFAADELAAYLRRNADQLRVAAVGAPMEQARVYRETADSLLRLVSQAHSDLEALEQRLTVMEERVIAAATEACTEEQLLDHRQRLTRQLAPYRRKMTAEQLAMVEKQYFQRQVLEAAGLPRLSLFYL